MAGAQTPCLADRDAFAADLHGDETWVNGGQGHWIWSARDRSARGTARFDVYIDRPGSPIANGTWTFQLRNNTSSWLNVHGYAADNLAQWEQGVRFDDNVAFAPTTVTSPGTADSAITVASCSTRGRNGTAPGALSPFSSRGPRLDGQSVVDIARPHYTLSRRVDELAEGDDTMVSGRVLRRHEQSGALVCR